MAAKKILVLSVRFAYPPGQNEATCCDPKQAATLVKKRLQLTDGVLVFDPNSDNAYSASPRLEPRSWPDPPPFESTTLDRGVFPIPVCPQSCSATPTKPIQFGCICSPGNRTVRSVLVQLVEPIDPCANSPLCADAGRIGG